MVSEMQKCHDKQKTQSSLGDDWGERLLQVRWWEQGPSGELASD